MGGRENPRRHKENMQTPHRGFEPSYCEVPVLTTSPPCRPCTNVFLNNLSVVSVALFSSAVVLCCVLRYSCVIMHFKFIFYLTWLDLSVLIHSIVFTWDPPFAPYITAMLGVVFMMWVSFEYSADSVQIWILVHYTFGSQLANKSLPLFVKRLWCP